MSGCRAKGLTDREPGGQLDPPGPVVCVYEALPHVQQGVGVQSESRNVVDQHDPHTKLLPATVRQNRVDVGCSANRQLALCSL